ncbi:MAG TPA: xanthine dehydrogenase family protein subunit M [Burkholderiales bacterium]|nr:xanthine dehydrogenase family protein subunit M [Burkholderiales bacterium]
MKAPSFAYAKAKSLAEAFDLIERPGAKILAGGQSLIPSLNMRLAHPDLLVDITGLRDLAAIEPRGASLRVGALATHAQIEKSDAVARHVPLLAEAVKHVAHPAIRNRGTIGGSIALADPAAEYPAVALALNATIVMVGRRGERRVSAEHFFKGLFETDVRPGELVAAVEFPKVERSVFLELARRHGDYAIVGLAGVADASGRRIAFFGAGATPVLAVHASRQNSVEAAQKALEQDLQPPADLYHTSATKLHLAKVLLSRAWNKLSKPH